MKYIDLQLMEVVEDPDTTGFKVTEFERELDTLYWDLDLYGYGDYRENQDSHYAKYFKSGNFKNYMSENMDTKLVDMNWVYYPARFIPLPKKSTHFPEDLKGFHNICQAIITHRDYYYNKKKAYSKEQRDKRQNHRQKRLDRIDNLKEFGIDLSMVLDRIKNEEMDVLLTQIEKGLEKNK